VVRVAVRGACLERVYLVVKKGEANGIVKDVGDQTVRKEATFRFLPCCKDCGLTRSQQGFKEGLRRYSLASTYLLGHGIVCRCKLLPAYVKHVWHLIHVAGAIEVVGHSSNVANLHQHVAAQLALNAQVPGILHPDLAVRINAEVENFVRAVDTRYDRPADGRK